MTKAIFTLVMCVAVCLARGSEARGDDPRAYDGRVPTAPVLFDTPDEISTNAQRLYQQAVVLKAMPLGNVTRMTSAEREKIAAWFSTRTQQ